MQETRTLTGAAHQKRSLHILRAIAKIGHAAILLAGDISRMDYEEAKLQLLLHASGQLILEDGFVTSLRPYSGLHERSFHLVMEALLTVGDRIHQSLQIDRDLADAIWSICSISRAWGLQPGGMLQRNRLITATDTARLERWVETVETTALRNTSSRWDGGTI
jgi:hypothetical protein